MFLRYVSAASILAVLAATTTAGVWLPSLVGGGLHLWQTLGAPAVFLLASGLLLRAWAVGRLDSVRASLRFAAVVTVAACATGAGLWYRIVEVPAPPVMTELASWLAEMPDPATDDTGKQTRAALAEVGRRRRELNNQPTRISFPGIEGQTPLPFSEELLLVLSFGWPRGDPELGGWLDRMFDSPWVRDLTRAADGPPGVVFDPQEEVEPEPTLSPNRDSVFLAVHLLAARGLRQQARGDDAAMAEALRVGLALVRHLRYRSSSNSWAESQQAEGTMMRGLARWLLRPGQRPESLRAIVVALREHERRCPRDPGEALTANYLVALNTIPHPEGWLRLTDPLISLSNRSAITPMAFMLKAPWERARQARVLGWLVSAQQLPAGAAYIDWPWKDFPLAHTRQFIELYGPSVHTAARARLLQVALRLYQADRGREAASLEALVPNYLPAIPADPLDPAARAFRYRLSRGETFFLNGMIRDPKTGNWERAHRRVPAGQGILWSVGTTNRWLASNTDAARTDPHDVDPSWVFFVDPPEK
jgi:hypothetical protein